MDFSLSDDQRDLVDLFASLFGREVPPSRVRAAEPGGHDPALWELVADAGAVGIALPEASGGAGFGLLEAALVAEQFGRVLAPIPLVEAVTAARLLVAAGEAAAIDPGPYVEGRRIATVALRPANAGVARLVPGAAVADLVLALDGDRLVAAPAGDDVQARRDLAASPLGDCPLHGRATVELAAGEQARTRLEEARRDWRCLMAAALVGAASAALDVAVAYVSEREQFGRPVGAFQAVAHGLADAATDIDGARLLALEAAWAGQEGAAEAASLAGMAFTFAAEAANAAAAKALHYHGGYGFMLEYDVQLYYRRIRAWPMPIGEQDVELLRLADELYGNVKETS